MPLKQQRAIASLDVGSSKIVCLVGYINAIGKIIIKGVGHQQSKGILSGKIINKKEVEKSILNTISIAEKMAGYTISSITVNINSSEIYSSTINSSIQLDNREVKDRDITILLKDIKDILKNDGKEIIHLMPLQYLLDDNIVDSPFNINTNNLKVIFHLLTTDKKELSKMRDCIKNMMLDIGNYVSNGYASSLSVLEKNEKELGVLMLDIGFSTTNVSLVYDDKYIIEYNIPLGGETITKDISSVLKITQETAEKVKVLNTNCNLSKINEEELIKIDIETDEDFEASKNRISLINNIAKARIEEIVNLTFSYLKENSLKDIPQYIVLTGGTAIIPGIDIFISQITDLETRVGYNSNYTFDKKISIELKSPIYTVSLGILQFIQNKYNDISIDTKNEPLLINILKKIFG